MGQGPPSCLLFHLYFLLYKDDGLIKRGFHLIKGIKVTINPCEDLKQILKFYLSDYRCIKKYVKKHITMVTMATGD